MTPHAFPKVRTTLLVCSLFAVSALPAFAQTTLARWTFDTAKIVSQGDHFAPLADDGGSGAATGHHSNDTFWQASVGNGSPQSLSSDNWSGGDYYQFQVSTLGATGISVSWDQTRSSTLPGGFNLFYSTNGSSFNDVASYSVLEDGAGNPVWNSGNRSPAYGFSFNLSSISAINNQTAVYFRLSADGTDTLDGTATSQIDNFTVTAIPEPSTYAASLGIAALGLAGFRRLRRRTV
jgi:hypothetical protein